MEFNIRSIFTLLLICYCSQERVSGQDLLGYRTPNDQNDLKQMLKVALQQNRQLELQNNKLRQIWTGLQQMCRAVIAAPKCDCPKPEVKPKPEIRLTEKKLTEETKVLETTEPLRVVSISSSGNSLGIDDAVNVTAHYTAPPDHTVEWIIFRMSGGMTRTRGQTGVYNEGNRLRRFTRMQFSDLNNTRTAMLRLHSDEETIHMRLNLTKLESAGNQNMPAPDKDLVQFKSSYDVPFESDLNIDVKVKGDVRDSPILAHSEIFFSGLNTSTEPHSVFEIFSLNINPSENGIGFVGQDIPNDTEFFNIRVTLKNSYVKYGGILTLRFPQTVNGYVNEFFTGKFVSILSPTDKTVVRYNSLGVYNLPPQTPVQPPSQSILCASMGNPLPDVSLLKVMQNGSLALQKSETLIKDRVSHVKSLTLFHNAPDTEGTYICRAENGNTSAETKTDVIVLRPVEFDDEETVVATTGPNDVTVTCQASGFPRPRAEVRLYDGFGPDLAASGQYKVDIATPTAMTSRLTLHLTPNDSDVHTVYCVAFQDNQMKKRRMEVFPSNRINWELYNRLSRNQ